MFKHIKESKGIENTRKKHVVTKHIWKNNQIKLLEMKIWN